ncbi:MAG: UDP-4-amino-4,6-dideoxy-N-acetyl-beta-L-altrosamine transaminase [Planctomycetaceae bacterium]|nr:UDP-4-amino-4,6-dideoxy-N-acetyl-beta-L-altrosamine transaminase [Planctomycetaceae bacterium]
MEQTSAAKESASALRTPHSAFPSNHQPPITNHHSPLPYGRHSVDADDLAAIVEVLQSDWLTTGPKVGELETAFAQATGVEHAVAVSSGTAALHAALHGLDLRPDDEVIVPAMTFAATANAVLYVGARPMFADVDHDTLLLNVEQVDRVATARTRAVIAVDYAGQPCDYDDLRSWCERSGATLVSDACHSLGGEYRGRPIGSLADLTTFSLHPVKVITSGEGGIVTTSNAAWATRLRQFRNHGIATDPRQREALGTWHYEQLELGYNYRLSDLHAALGLSQLRKLPRWITRRRQLAAQYDAFFAAHPGLRPLAVRPEVGHAYHLYVVRMIRDRWQIDRRALFNELRSAGIGVQVHYIPVHMHPYYQQRLGTHAGLCPNAESAYEEILSLPLFPAMSDEDVSRVVATVEQLWQRYGK